MITLQKKGFLTEDFLLETEAARTLYFDYAVGMPIIDYHNHLSPAEIASNHTFDNLTQIWLNGDHYKWRAMRTLGVHESYITGTRSDEEKFTKWAETVPYTLRNPLYHWTHLELKRYFGIDEVLNPDSAAHIYSHASAMLQQDSHSVQGLLQQMQVRVVCTTDDPADSLEYHVQLRQNPVPGLRMNPSFRPDKYILIDQAGFLPALQLLGSVLNREIKSYGELLDALRTRALFFDSLGCRASDHGLEYIPAVAYTEAEVEAIFSKRVLSGEVLSPNEAEKFKSALLFELGKMYHQLGWVMQLHLGALRNNNLKAMATLGPDTGWDSIGDWSQAKSLSTLLGRLDAEDKLTKTILYNLNPADNEVMASMIGNFNDGSVKGKIQFGSGWWFLDQKDGMQKQINALSNLGLLSCFVGMLTDSRSFLSFPRHEYFRRILCNMLGSDIERGELPADIPWIGKIVQDICYNNAAAYFGFEE